MNKKAIISYIVLLIFVIIMYFYIQSTISKLTISPTTTLPSNYLRNSSNIKNGSSYLIVTTVNNSIYYTTVPCEYNGQYLNSGNCQQQNTNFSTCNHFGGFTCSNLFLSSITGNLTFTFSEDQYSNWVSAEIFLLNSTTAPQPINNFVNVTDSVRISNISNSEQITVTVPAIKPKLQKGINIAGNIWALFHLSNSNTTYLSEIANFTATSV
ncbi:MAG: hypothetical protein QXD23_03130 [Candidatus Micrarchaeaceae archaeon]